MTEPLTATFRASLPPIQTAINFDGSDGVRIKLDIPEQDAIEAAKLIGMRGKVLRVTVELLEDVKITPKRTVKHG